MSEQKPKRATKTKAAKYESKSVEELDSSPIVPASVSHKVTTSGGTIKSVFEQAELERMDRLRKIEDDLLQESLEVVQGAVKFAEILPGETEPTGDFFERYKDHPDPEKLHRIMSAAWSATKDAPVGLAIAQRTAMGIIKARATEKGKPQPLNVAVQIVTQLPDFKVIDVE